jgi:DNA-binding NarL/FixJ family response regulator
MSKEIRIVLADDHQVLRDGLRTLLEQEADFRVVGVAGDGRSTVKLAAVLKPDVVVMDIGMPELNGIDATHQIASLQPDVKVLCLSIHHENNLVASILRAGANGYVPKTAAAKEVVTAIRTLVAGKTYLSPLIAQGLVERYVRGEGDEYPGAYERLTDREREILQLVAEGHDSQAIADRLFICVKTVLSHRQRLMSKLGLDTTAALTRYAIREGIVDV